MLQNTKATVQSAEDENSVLLHCAECRRCVAAEPFHSDKPGKAISEGQLRGNLWGWTNCARSVSVQKAALLSGASTALRREGPLTATAQTLLFESTRQLLSRQDRWPGKPCHVTCQHPGHRHVIPPAVPPCMTRYRRFAAPCE